MLLEVRSNAGYRKMYLMIFIYRILLDIVYCTCASQVFGYIGLTYNYDMLKLALSWLLLLLSLPTLRRCTEAANFSHTIMLFLIYLSFIPYTTMIAFFGFGDSYILANSLYWIWMLLLFNYLPRFKGKLVIESENNDMILTIIEGVFAAAILFISWRYTGLRFTISLSNVYTYRAEAKVASMPAVLSYLFAASKAVNPVLLVYSLNRKKHINTVLITIVQILSFSVNGSKTVFFSTILAIVLYFIYSESLLKKMPGAMAALCMLTYIETKLRGTTYLLAYFVRRVLFVPNQLGSYYFDFFSVNTPDYYKQSFLRLFGAKSQYSDVDHIIGAYYFGKPDMGANSGLISDAVTNLGIAGIFIMPIILVIILKILDMCSEGIEKRIYISTSITIAFILISSFLPTVLLTHGLIALCIVLMLIPRNNQNVNALG